MHRAGGVPGGVRITALNSSKTFGSRVYAIDKRPRGLSIFASILGNSVSRSTRHRPFWEASRGTVQAGSR